MKEFQFWSVLVFVFILAACSSQDEAVSPDGEENPPRETVILKSVANEEAVPAPVVVAESVRDRTIIPIPKPAPVITERISPIANSEWTDESVDVAGAGREEMGEAMPEESAAAEPEIKTSFFNIKAELAADPIITVPGNPGELRVWVGDPAFKASFPTEMAATSAVIVTSVKPGTVRVTPNAPAFSVVPESVCTKFDPAGTTVPFKLQPTLERAGKYRVGAGVWLYESDDCTGTPNPKEAPDLQVEVAVKVMPDDMLKTVRDAISQFWIGLVGLLVGLLLFFARNLLKKLFGFEGK